MDQRKHKQAERSYPPSSGPRGSRHPPGAHDAARRASALLGLVLLPALAAAQAPSSAPIPDATPVEASVSAPALASVALGEAPPAAVTPALLERPDGWSLGVWLDLPHAFLERRIFGIVNGFDRFFADEHDLACARSSSFLRLRSEVRVAKDGTFDFGTSVRADLTLPYIRKRLRRLQIVLENAGRDLIDSGPAPAAGREDAGRADAVLRLTLLDTLRSSLDLGGGVLFDIPPGLVGRIRFRHAHELGRVALARVAVTSFWNTRDGFGSNGSIAFERALARPLLLRWTSGTLVSQVSDGFESASELALLAPLGRFTGLTVLGGASGQSKPDLVLETWRVAARLRTSLYRGWIFGEVEPEVTWPLDAAGGRRPVPAVVFRLEIQFEEAPRKSGVAGDGQCGLASSSDRPRGGA